MEKFNGFWVEIEMHIILGILFLDLNTEMCTIYIPLISLSLSLFLSLSIYSFPELFSLPFFRISQFYSCSLAKSEYTLLFGLNSIQVI